jgi:hypothetical protein
MNSVTTLMTSHNTDRYAPLFNERSDMWAFGVTLWEIASYGKVPYGNIPLTKTLESVCNGRRLEWPTVRCAFFDGIYTI